MTQPAAQLEPGLPEHEARYLKRIAAFCAPYFEEHGITLLDCVTGLVAAHHAQPLQLEWMAANSHDGAKYAGSVLHDMAGIFQHFDPVRRCYRDCFVPRFDDQGGA